MGGNNQRGLVSTPENPGSSALMLWIRDHIGHQGEECLIWPFGRCQGGYANIGRAGKAIYVHRLMCERRNGPPPSPTHHAAHSCGKGHEGCVNPCHLSWKTPANNQADRRQHGTLTGRRYRLTPEKVAVIRASRDPVLVIAKQFNVTEATIRQIRSGKTWRTGTYAVGGFTSATARAANQKRRDALATSQCPTEPK